MENRWGKSRMDEWTKGSVGALALYNGFWLTYSAQGDDKAWQKDLRGDERMWEKCGSKRWGLGWVEMKPNVEQEGGDQPIQDSQWAVVIVYVGNYVIQGGADKSLARLTSRCRRTESIVSLERGVCSCAELQVFSCYRGRKEVCQATAQFQHRDASCRQVFFFHAR